MRKQIIADNFGDNRLYYDAHALPQKQAAEKLASLLPEKTAPKILEIGCGTGFLTNKLFAKYPDGEFHITDLSSKMVNYCEQKYPNKQATYFQMDAEAPQCDNHYDFIVSAMTLQWLDHPIKAIQNLAKKGDIYYSSLGKNNFKEWKDALKQNHLNDGTLPTINWPNISTEDHIRENYEDGRDFIRMLKKTGVSTPSENYTPLNQNTIKKALKSFNGEITWHIVYGHLPIKTD